MNLFVTILIVLLLVWVTYLIVRVILKRHRETITAYTGGLGSGKTFLSVRDALKCYAKLNRKYRIYCFLHPRKNVNKPVLYSNIPLRIKGKLYSTMLTKEHLLLQESLVRPCVVLLDEIGAFANQFDFKNDNVINTFDEFVRFFRHYTYSPYSESYMIVNDQCSENINLVVRRRLNKVHNLSNMLHIGPMVFYYERMINISEEIKTIDDENDTQDSMSLRFLLCFNKKHYDSHCYSGRYDSLPESIPYCFTRLKTNFAIKCPTKEHIYKSLTRKED